MAEGTKESDAEYIELLHPESQQTVYFHNSSGTIVFCEPPNAKIKPMSQNQWWELFDASSDSHYYHNPHTQETVWERPSSSGADIVSLTKLQDALAAEEVDAGENGTVVAVEDGRKDQEPPVDQAPSKDEKAGTPVLSRIPSQDIFGAPLDTLSPLNVEYNGHRFSAFEADIDASERKRKQSPSNELTVSTTKHSSSTRSSRLSDSSGTHHVKAQTLARHSRIEDEIKHSQERNTGSKERVRRLSSELESSHPQVQILAPKKSPTGQEKSVEEKRVESFCMLSVSEAPNPERGLAQRKSKSTKTRPAPPVPTMPGSSSTLNSSVRKSQNRASYAYAGRPPPAPAPPPIPGSIPRSISLQTRSDRPTEPLDRFGELAQHKKGLFRRKVTIANMLAWTKDPIKQPMIQTRDKLLKKEAVEMFKLVLQYMGDKKTKIRDVDEIALQITSQAWEKKGLRDEVYIQLCRQTTGNPKTESLRRGWELFTISLAFFPPSFKFRSYLEGYLWRHVDPNPDVNKGVPVEVYAQHCHKRVEKMTQTGAKRGVKKPSIEEIKHAKNNPFYSSVFGTTLEEAMELQADKHPDLTIPWVIKELFETVLRLDGPKTEGIFRVPGDIDEVNALKLHIDKGNPPPSTLTDPNVPASLLKLWFRELEDPLIPENYYQSCIDNCTHEANAISIMESLPDLNKHVLEELLSFLKKFISPENIQLTRMSVENIAMVWAPNILRCPSDDHMLIFENTRKEMAFLRILLVHQDTSTS